MRQSLLGWMLAACWGAAALYAVPALGEEPEAGPYDVALLTLKNDWHAIRYNRQTGDSWYSLQGDWKSIPEADQSAPPPGYYKLLLTASGANDFIALRLETKSGRSWRLAALKWIEMKVLEPDPAPPPIAPEFGNDGE